MSDQEFISTPPISGNAGADLTEIIKKTGAVKRLLLRSSCFSPGTAGMEFCDAGKTILVLKDTKHIGEFSPVVLGTRW